MLVTLVFVVVVAFSVCLLLLSRSFRLQARLEELVDELERERQRGRRARQELRQLQDDTERLDREQRFLSRFLRELPLLAGELHSRVQTRRIPELLLKILVHALEPERAVVLLRRRKSGERGPRFVVAAVHPPKGEIRLGDEVVAGEGPLGILAEAQLAMDRSDFARQRSVRRRAAGAGAVGRLVPQLGAPMVFDGETVGLIAVDATEHEGPEAKTAMRLVAQLGALAVHNAAVYAQTKRSADVDGLTRIFNKRHMTEMLGELVYQAKEEVSELSVFLFDIDHFKVYNDRNGHVAGDRLLSELAELVSGAVRDQDLVGRFGGEEFLVVLPRTPLLQAIVVAEKVRALIADHPFAHAEGQPLGMVSVSGGVATYPTHGLDTVTLLRAADVALYEAKQAGRNRVLAAKQKYLSGDESDLLVVDRDLIGDPSEE